MNKLKQLLVMAVLALGVAACGDDPAPEMTNSAAVTGDYYGSVTATSGRIVVPMTTPGDTVSLTALTATTVRVDYKSATWGQASFPEAAVTKAEDGSYTVVGTGKIGMISQNNGQPWEGEATLDGTVSADRKAYSFTIHIPSLMLNGTTLVVK